jgi:peptidyl-prolyl cis-trans isomerase B (cyclophilin B)
MAKQYASPPAMAINPEHTYLATIETTRGTIQVELLPKDAPKSVNNFVFLARDGFYDGLTFHRVEDWVVQGGDPFGRGYGGPGYQWEDEPVKGEYRAGVMAMANAGPNTNGSQFFFLKRDTPLPKQYNLFGRIIRGQDVVNQLRKGDTMTAVRITETDAAGNRVDA